MDFKLTTTIPKVDEGLLALKGVMRSKTLAEGPSELETGWFELRERVCGNRTRRVVTLLGACLRAVE